MSTKNSVQCRRNLTVDIKLWFSEIDCLWHYTLLAFEDGNTLHSSTADTYSQALSNVEYRIAKLMAEEAHEIQGN
jgi:transcriptional antiterminator Rof (Rho-off)